MESVITKNPLDSLVLSKAEIFQAAVDNPVIALQKMGGLGLLDFVDLMWDEVNQDPFVYNWHIGYLCNELEKIADQVGNRLPKIADVIINIPPGTSKTMICSVMFPVWCWTKYPWMKFLTGSYSDTLALASAEKGRDILRSNRFKAVYPDIYIKEDKNTKTEYQIAHVLRDEKGRKIGTELGGSRFSTSVLGTITGFHGHINIWDDPINPLQSVSETQLKKVNDWVDKTASSRKAQKELTTTIMVMQRLHEDDPSGHVLAKREEGKKIHHICLPGEIKEYEAQVQPPELIKYYVDGLLDTKRLTWKSLNELRVDLGENGYAGQIGQNPTPPGGSTFKVKNLKIIESMPSSANIKAILRYWDKAATENGGKRSAGVKLALLKNNTVVIMDVVKGQWAPEFRERMIKNTAFIDGVDVEIWIEQEPGSGGKESADSTIKNLAGYLIYRDIPKGDKSERAGPLSVQVNEGNVFLLKGEWNKGYIDELEKFPNGKFKDQVDASSAGYNIITGRKVAGRIT